MAAGFSRADEQVPEWYTEDLVRRANQSAIRTRNDLPGNMLKYWNARHDLFSQFSEGILLDEESWFSVTPEAVAYRIAVQCASDVVLDAFCGAGGNAIQFAMTCKRVIAIDIDPVKLAMARHNASIYGVEDRITFLCGDFCAFAEAHASGVDADGCWQGWHREAIDVVFLSPPWGGVDYLNPDLLTPEKALKVSTSSYTDLYPLRELRPVGGQKLFQLAYGICDKIVLYLPRNVNLDEVARLAQLVPDTPLAIHAEELWLGYKFKALAVFLSHSAAPP